MASSLLKRIDGLLDRILTTDGKDTVVSNRNNDEKADDSSEDGGRLSKHFHMELKNVVFDAIDGELYTNPNLTRLYVPNDDSIKVVYRRDWSETNKEKQRIAVLSGGGSGHEPCFWGYVGKGMLTGAIAGEIFSSPTTKSVLYAILRVSLSNQKFGALLLIGNYTGDVLNFSLAMKIAETQYGIPSKAIFLADDIALPENKNVGARGIAGQVLTHKIAGYYAEAGKSLDEVYDICLKLQPNIGTVGISASIMHHFGSRTKLNEEMNDNILELGLGVHGEPGFEQIKNDNIYNVIKNHVMPLFKKFLNINESSSSLKSNEKQRIVLLLNNLGSVTNMEMFIIKKYLLDFMYYKYNNTIIIERFYSGPFETSLDMKGFSVTIMKNITDELLKALDADVPTIKAWSKGERIRYDSMKNTYYKPELQSANKVTGNEDDNKTIDENTRQVLDLISSNNKTKSNDNVNKNLVNLTDKQSKLLKSCIISCCNTIILNKKLLNKLDHMVGDGDCGSTLEFGCNLLLNAINDNNNELLNCKSLVLTFSQISQLLSDMGGSSGALYGYLFICASNHCSLNMTDNKLNNLQLCKSLKNAIYDLSNYSKAKLNDRTMLDALIPGIESIVNSYNKDKNNNISALKELSKAANDGCQRTQDMTAKFGRSSYIASQLQTKCVDPGAQAVALWINSIVNVLLEYNKQ